MQTTLEQHGFVGNLENMDVATRKNYYMVEMCIANGIPLYKIPKFWDP